MYLSPCICICVRLCDKLMNMQLVKSILRYIVPVVLFYFHSYGTVGVLSIIIKLYNTYSSKQRLIYFYYCFTIIHIFMEICINKEVTVIPSSRTNVRI